jgi:hypothetical protein
VRLAITASPLQLHFSPYRYQQLMVVLQSAMAAEAADAGRASGGGSGSGAAGGSGGSHDKPLWLSEAEYTAKVAVLTWEGLTSSVSKWQTHRWLHVWRGRLYLTASKDEPEVLSSKTYWMTYRVVHLQPSVSARLAATHDAECNTQERRMDACAAQLRGRPSVSRACLTIG